MQRDSREVPIAIFRCSKCNHEVKVPDANVGKKGKCPKCGNVSRIEEAPPEPPPEEPSEPSSEASLPRGMKECPICGELIRAKARKCRFCGEIIDKGLATAKKREKQRDMMRRRRIYGSSEVSSAKSALVCGIIGIFCVGVILGPIAILLGISALNELKRRPGATGGGMATAGIVLGIIDIIGSVIMIAIAVSD